MDFQGVEFEFRKVGFEGVEVENFEFRKVDFEGVEFENFEFRKVGEKQNFRFRFAKNCWEMKSYKSGCLCLEWEYHSFHFLLAPPCNHRRHCYDIPPLCCLLL